MQFGGVAILLLGAWVRETLERSVVFETKKCGVPYIVSVLLLSTFPWYLFFERSEFLIPTWVTPQYRATSKKKNLCVCSTNLGFSGRSANRYCCRTLRLYDTRYVFCTSYVCTWYQPAEIYTYVRYVFDFVSPFCFSTAPPHFW